MSLIRKTVPASPSDLQDSLRTSQAQHAEAVAAANAKLVREHDEVFGLVSDRRQTLREQVSLLQAEHDALEPVLDAADSTKLPVSRK